MTPKTVNGTNVDKTLNLYPTYEKKIPLTLTCDLDIIAEVLYGKLKIRLLYSIAQRHLRPSDLQKKTADASPRVLFIKLKELEANGVVTRSCFAEMPPRVEYWLSDFGRTLTPIIYALTQWEDEHQDYLQDLILVAEKKKASV